MGVPDDKWGETVKPPVVLRPGAVAPEAELIEFCGATCLLQGPDLDRAA